MQYWSIRGSKLFAIALPAAIGMVCLGLVACSTVPALEAIAQPYQSPTEARVTFQGEAPHWAEDAAAVMTDIENWRGQSFSEPLQVTFQPQDEPGLNGWYNSETKELVVTTDGSAQMGRGVLLHEIFHALQDQTFDLYQLRLDRLSQPDANQALSAIIEGEAMLAVSELLNYNFLDHARLPAEGEVSEDYFENLFVYGSGLRFIQAVREAGGWAAVDQVFQNPPQSTALILNPQRYLAGARSPEPIDIALKPGETLEQEIERGAYGVQWLVAQAEETRSQLDEFAEHYESDRLAILQTETGETIHRWAVRFDSPEAAAQLSTALVTATAQQDDLETAPQVLREQGVVTLEW